MAHYSVASIVENPSATTTDKACLGLSSRINHAQIILTEAQASWFTYGFYCFRISI